jgi:hypothetical protein
MELNKNKNYQSTELDKILNFIVDEILLNV